MHKEKIIVDGKELVVDTYDTAVHVLKGRKHALRDIARLLKEEEGMKADKELLDKAWAKNPKSDCCLQAYFLINRGISLPEHVRRWLLEEINPPDKPLTHNRIMSNLLSGRRLTK